MKKRSPETRLKHQIARREAKQEKKMAKGQFWERPGKNLRGILPVERDYSMDLQRTIVKEAERLATQLRTLVEPEEIGYRWAKYFCQLLNVQEDREKMIPTTGHNIDKNQITKEKK